LLCALWIHFFHLGNAFIIISHFYFNYWRRNEPIWATWIHIWNIHGVSTYFQIWNFYNWAFFWLFSQKLWSIVDFQRDPSMITFACLWVKYSFQLHPFSNLIFQILACFWFFWICALYLYHKCESGHVRYSSTWILLINKQKGAFLLLQELFTGLQSMNIQLNVHVHVHNNMLILQVQMSVRIIVVIVEALYMKRGAHNLSLQMQMWSHRLSFP